MLDDRHHYTVTDLKQFAYCGRVVYYEHCLPHLRPRTFKMDAGRDEHALEQKRALRRTLQKYALPAGESTDGRREFDVALTDPVRNFTGILDEVVYTPTGAIFPVDYKLADKVSANHRLQLMAYAYLLEQAHQVVVPYGFIYLIKGRKFEKVTMTASLRHQLDELLQQIEETVKHERIPPATTVYSRCPSCEFRRFCNDV